MPIASSEPLHHLSSNESAFATSREHIGSRLSDEWPRRRASLQSIIANYIRKTYRVPIPDRAIGKAGPGRLYRYEYHGVAKSLIARRFREWSPSEVATWLKSGMLKVLPDESREVSERGPTKTLRVGGLETETYDIPSADCYRPYYDSPESRQCEKSPHWGHSEPRDHGRIVISPESRWRSDPDNSSTRRYNRSSSPSTSEIFSCSRHSTTDLQRHLPLSCNASTVALSPPASPSSETFENNPRAESPSHHHLSTIRTRTASRDSRVSPKPQTDTFSVYTGPTNTKYTELSPAWQALAAAIAALPTTIPAIAAVKHSERYDILLQGHLHKQDFMDGRLSLGPRLDFKAHILRMRKRRDMMKKEHWREDATAWL